MRTRTKISLAALGLLGLGGVLLMQTDMGPIAPSQHTTAHTEEPPQGRELKVLTLNIAHGRGTALHQLLLPKATIDQNLQSTADLLKRHGAHVVALQEVDGPSAWTSYTKQALILAERAGYRHALRGSHVHRRGLQYGTALLSSLPVSAPSSTTFAATPPTFSKGFVVLTVAHPASPTGQVEVVSVHLDFSRSTARRRQIQTLIDTLGASQNPLVLMGDFNTEWAEEPAMQHLVDSLGLSTHAPLDNQQVSFLAMGKRIDWILFSSELELLGQQTAPELVSDHQAVIATLRFR